jgi:hypothetical protein
MSQVLLTWKEPPAARARRNSFLPFAFRLIEWVPALLTICFLVYWRLTWKLTGLEAIVIIDLMSLYNWMELHISPTYTIENEGIRQRDWRTRKFVPWTEIEAYWVSPLHLVPGLASLHVITDPSTMDGEKWDFDPQVVNEQQLLDLLTRFLPSKHMVPGTESEQRLLRQYERNNDLASVPARVTRHVVPVSAQPWSGRRGDKGKILLKWRESPVAARRRRTRQSKLLFEFYLVPVIISASFIYQWLVSRHLTGLSAVICLDLGFLTAWLFSRRPHTYQLEVKGIRRHHGTSTKYVRWADIKWYSVTPSRESDGASTLMFETRGRGLHTEMWVIDPSMVDGYRVMEILAQYLPDKQVVHGATDEWQREENRRLITT